MKLIAALAAWLLVASAAACPLPGQAVHWIADSCMQAQGTDDLEAASACINAELARRDRPRDDCAAAHHYKRLMCRRAIQAGLHAGPVVRCVADPAFFGVTVRTQSVAASAPRPAASR